jgi:hypothetical protein
MQPHPDYPDEAAIALGRFFLNVLPDQAWTRLGSSTIEKRTPAL